MNLDQDLTRFRFRRGYLSDGQDVRRSIAFINNCFHNDRVVFNILTTQPPL